MRLLCLLSLALLGAVHALNVHIVPHTHDDVGWLKTVDQYYMGSNSSIQNAGVQFILDSVVWALQQNPLRKFVYVEQGFFQRWWREQTQATQTIVQKLVSNGQLEFINGGWCMHDEAATHYIDMIDQTTLGHKFILQQFGVTPRIGWQIDPFGHSSVQASLLSAEVGFDGLFFGRMDYQDHDLRMKNKQMEFVWDASPSLGSQSAVFTGAFQSGNYGPPSGFCFDLYCGDDSAPVQDDPRLEDYNVKSRVDDFVNAALDASSHTLGNNVIFTMGSDFQYSQANLWYKNLDKLIKYVNQDGRVNAFYSTPSEYVDAKNDEKITFPVKTDDFFPYADGPAQFWTGYFTSRPALKRYIRMTSHLLQVFRQIDALSGGDGSVVSELEESQSVAQHHDAVSGTSKQHVAFDYAKRISKGVNVALPSILRTLANWLSLNSSSTPPSLQTCFLSNITICPTTQHNSNFVIVAYNSLLRPRTELLSIPVSANVSYKVTDGQQLLPYTVTPAVVNRAKLYQSAPYILHFSATTPALGYHLFSVEASSSSVSTPPSSSSSLRFASHSSKHNAQARKVAAADVSISNGITTVTISSSGFVNKITDVQSQLSLSVVQEFFWYASFQGDNSNPSGAYIFRTNTSGSFPIAASTIPFSVTASGPVVWEVQQQVTPWYTQIIRLVSGDPVVQLEYTVGDIPIDDGQGKEIVTRFSTSLQTNSTFYTDSNGRDFLQRIINYRPSWNLTVTEPIAGNFYPMNAAAYITDNTNAFAILNDRSQGVASLGDGQIEIMIHRRTLKDDWRGVGEPLNETESCTPYPNFQRLGRGLVVTGTHFLVLSPLKSLFSIIRPLQQRIFAPLFPTFAPLTVSSSSFFASHVASWSFTSISAPGLPSNVELMTLQSWNNNTVLLRLAHSFASGEDSVLSLPAQVNLSQLVAGVYGSVSEMSLTANRPLSSVQRLKWQTDSTPIYVKRGGLQGSIATLTPLEIRTYFINRK